MAEVKAELLKEDPKLQETLRLVQAHQAGRVEDSFKAQGAEGHVPPSPSFSPSSSSLANPATRGWSVVVSSCFLRCLFLFQKLLEEAGISCGIMQGCLTVEQRKAVLKDFEEGRVDVLLLSQYCGAEGITLTSSNRMILTDVGLSPSMAEQVMARVHRLGQEKEVLVSRLCAATTIEDFLIHDLLPQKLRVIDENFMVSGGDEDDDADEEEWDGREGREEELEDALGVLEALEDVGAEGGEASAAQKVMSIAQGVAAYWGSQGGERAGECAGEKQSDRFMLKPKLEPKLEPKDEPIVSTATAAGGVTNKENLDIQKHAVLPTPHMNSSSLSGNDVCGILHTPDDESIIECKEEGAKISVDVTSGEHDRDCDGDDGHGDFWVEVGAPCVLSATDRSRLVSSREGPKKRLPVLRPPLQRRTRSQTKRCGANDAKVQCPQSVQEAPVLLTLDLSNDVSDEE